jgi:hypothetical protein
MHRVAGFNGGRGVRSTVSEDFVKSFRKGLKVTIVQSDGNGCSWFFEGAVYAVGCWRVMTMFPEGRNGRGWSRVFRELSKAITFLEAMVKALYAGGALVGECLGKAAGPLSFAEVLRSKPTFHFIDCGPFGPVDGGGLV